MCGKETQTSQGLSAFSRGTYCSGLRGLSMLKGGSQTSTGNGYHLPPAAPAPETMRPALPTNPSAVASADSLLILIMAPPMPRDLERSRALSLVLRSDMPGFSTQATDGQFCACGS